MTRSIFDPTGPETEHSGSRNLGPDAANNSHMPPSVTDGKVSEEESADLEALARAAHPGAESLGQALSAELGENVLDVGSNPDNAPVESPGDLSNPGREA